MNPESFVVPNVYSMSGYVPGEQLNDPDIIKLNTNENPFPPSQAVINALKKELDLTRLQLYPDPVSGELRRTLANKFKRSEDNILAGNGSDDVLAIFFRTFLSGKELLIPWPTYSLYPVLAAIYNTKVIFCDLNSDWSVNFEALLSKVHESSKPPIVMFANPNAPTGVNVSSEKILLFAENNPGLTLIDEAYAAFGGDSVMKEAGSSEFPRLLASGTFSKSHSLAGQRIGWITAHPDFILEMDKVRDSYNLSKLSQVAAVAALNDTAEHEKRFKEIIRTREFTASELKKRGFSFPESKTNFLFIKPPENIKNADSAKTTAEEYYEYLKGKKLLIRYFSQERIKEYVRVTIGRDDQMKKFLEITDQFIDSRKGA